MRLLGAVQTIGTKEGVVVVAGVVVVVVAVVEGVVVSGADSVDVGDVDWFVGSVGGIVVVDSCAVVAVEDVVEVSAFCPQPVKGVNIIRKIMATARNKDACFIVAPPSSWGRLFFC
jgi:hypothetical protein